MTKGNQLFLSGKSVIQAIHKQQEQVYERRMILFFDVSVKTYEKENFQE